MQYVKLEEELNIKKVMASTVMYMRKDQAERNLYLGQLAPNPAGPKAFR